MTTSADVKIQGREYRVACAPEELESLQAAADLLNSRMGEIAQATKTTGERLAVMTALNLAAELNTARKPDTSVPAPQGIDGEGVQRRIKSIEARLDEALAAQEKLF
jgi:cell division protein ZapA